MYTKSQKNFAAMKDSYHEPEMDMKNVSCISIVCDQEDKGMKEINEVVLQLRNQLEK